MYGYRYDNFNGEQAAGSIDWLEIDIDTIMPWLVPGNRVDFHALAGFWGGFSSTYLKVTLTYANGSTNTTEKWACNSTEGGVAKGDYSTGIDFLGLSSQVPIRQEQAGRTNLTNVKRIRIERVGSTNLLKNVPLREAMPGIRCSIAGKSVQLALCIKTESEPPYGAGNWRRLTVSHLPARRENLSKAHEARGDVVISLWSIFPEVVAGYKGFLERIKFVKVQGYTFPETAIYQPILELRDAWGNARKYPLYFQDTGDYYEFIPIYAIDLRQMDHPVYYPVITTRLGDLYNIYISHDMHAGMTVGGAWSPLFEAVMSTDAPPPTPIQEEGDSSELPELPYELPEFRDYPELFPELDPDEPDQPGTPLDMPDSPTPDQVREAMLADPEDMLDLYIDDEEWENAVLDSASFSSGGLRLTYPRHKLDSIAPIQAGKWYRVWYEGEIVMMGIAEAPVDSIDAGRYVWECKINDPFYLLDHALCVTITTGGNIVPGLMLTNEERKTCGLSEAIHSILSRAIGNNLPIRYSVSGVDNNLGIPWTDGANSYGQLLRNAARWQPNLVSCWDYTGEYPILIIRAYDQLPVHTLEISDEDIERINLQPRYEMVPPAVAICGRTVAYVNVDENRGVALPRITNLSVIYPPNADPRKPFTMIHDIGDQTVQTLNRTSRFSENETEEEEKEENTNSAWGWQYHKGALVMTIKGKKLPTEGQGWTKWLKEKLPLEGNIRVIGAKVIDREGEGSATKYEHIEGIISPDTKGIKAGKVFVRLKVAHQGHPSEEEEKYFPEAIGNNNYAGYIDCTINTCSTTKRSFYADGTLEEIPGEETVEELQDPENEDNVVLIPYESTVEGVLAKYETVYRPICEAIYKATRALPWDGEIPLDTIAPHLQGHCINIAGGRQAWENMRTICQRVSVDFSTETTTLSVGTPALLGISDLLSLQDASQKETKKSAEGKDKEDELEDEVKEQQENILSLSYAKGNEERKKKKAKEAPSISPGCVITPQTGVGVSPHDFYVRAVKDESGKIVGVEAYAGRVRHQDKVLTIPQNAPYAPLRTATGTIYLNVAIAIDGTMTGGFSTEPVQTKLRRLSPRDYKNDPEAGIIYVDQPGSPGTYSFRIATIEGNKIIQHAHGELICEVEPQPIFITNS